MKNDEFAKILKQNRKQNNYSVSDVAYKLKEEHTIVAEKTIYGWESGQTQPDADTLLKLCKIYGIPDVLTEFGYVKVSPDMLHLTEREEELVRKFREHPELHEAIEKLLDIKKDS
ncbi:MAG: helix-turn-helix transcriptional regulator [Lachnospiraceae bacterium]|nr:helix-turn-helix transcriptional regulator [Lachnospiraceae bacterium]